MKARDLKKGDKAQHGVDGEVLTFVKMDGMYAQWKNENGDIKVGHVGEYKIQSNGIYLG